MGRRTATSMTAADIWGRVGVRASGVGVRTGPPNERAEDSCTLRIVRSSARMGLVVAASFFFGRSAAARRRPLFEPTDLEMEDAGALEVDLQFGLVRGRDPWRLVVPDFEVDIGLAPGIEVDIDGAYAIEGPDDGGFSFVHPGPDNLWVAAKLGLYDQVDEGTEAGWAVGAQLGPKLPIAIDAHGIGYEALLLVGRHHFIGDNHLVLNLGAFVDPGGTVFSQRPVGLEGGVDL